MKYNSLFELTGKQSGIVSFDGNSFVINWRESKGLPKAFPMQAGIGLGGAFPKESDMVFELKSKESFPDGLEALQKYCAGKALLCMIQGLAPQDLKGKSGQILKAGADENGKKQDILILTFDDWK